MDVAAVMDALGAQLERISGLRVFAYPAPGVVPPVAMIGWPSAIDYDQAMGRAAWSATFPVLIAVGKGDVRSARDTIGAYLAGKGPDSVRVALDGPTVAYDEARVTSAHVEPITIAGIEYLAAILDVEIVGGI